MAPSRLDQKPQSTLNLDAMSDSTEGQDPSRSTNMAGNLEIDDPESTRTRDSRLTNPDAQGSSTVDTHPEEPQTPSMQNSQNHLNRMAGNSLQGAGQASENTALPSADQDPFTGRLHSFLYTNDMGEGGNRDGGQTGGESLDSEVLRNEATSADAAGAAGPGSESRDQETATGAGGPPSSASAGTEDELGATASGMRFLDELLDTVFGFQRTSSAGANADPAHSQNAGPASARVSTGPEASPGTENLSANPNPGNAQNPDLPTAIPSLGTQNSAISLDVPNSADGRDAAGAIVITVNYMFMDGTDAPAPGQTGSLVVTIPNNATNREPHIISLFISLATRMAYSALVHNGPKRKPGVTLEKFRSFKRLDAAQLADRTCLICFETYDSPAVNVEDLITTKRRKLSPTRHIPSESATPEPLTSYAAQIERDRPPSDALHAGRTYATPPPPSHAPPQASVGGSTEGNAADSTEPTETPAAPEMVYLCDHEEEFDHTPVEMPCKHVFGCACLAHWLKEASSCPLCRQSVADPNEAAAPRSGPVPISYIRFGGMGDLASSLGALSEGGAENNSGESNAATEGNGGLQEAPEGAETPTNGSPLDRTSLQGLLRRATLVILNPAARRREAPASPLDMAQAQNQAQAREARDRNPSLAPMINNIQNYFRRSRGQRRAETGAGAASPFASGVSSRRTANGVETVASDNPLRPSFLDPGTFIFDFGRAPRPAAADAGGSGGSGNSTDSNMADAGMSDAPEQARDNGPQQPPNGPNGPNGPREPSTDDGN